MKHKNVINLFSVVSRPYPEYFWMKHTETLERIMKRFHERYETEKYRGAV
jgi:hypothetical protein